MTGDLILYEMLLRGLAVGALAATFVGWWRGGAGRDAKIAGLLLLATVASFALNSAPALNPGVGHLPPVVALASSTPGALWLFCAVLFEDRKVSWRTLAPTLVLLAITLTAMLIPPPGCEPVWILGELARAVICLLLLTVLWRGRRGDLVERRRRLRGPLLAGVALYAIFQAWLGLSAKLGTPLHGYGLDNSLAGALVLAAFTLTGAAVFLQGPADLFTPARRAAAPNAVEDGLKAQDRMALNRLAVLMQDRELWRREGLTIGDVAREVAIPEHRLRRLINTRLGHRNFAAFLNTRRIEAAKAELARTSGTAISTLAFDLGYASLGPFNRAFKEATGLTPSEFRRQAAGEASPISG